MKQANALRMEMANYYAEDSTLTAMHNMVNEMDFNKNLKRKLTPLKTKYPRPIRLRKFPLIEDLIP
jgi:hypothetical protein